MKKNVFFTIVALFTIVFSMQAQKEVSGVKVSNTLSIEGQNLTLNGAGIREKMWIDLYVGSLYLPKKSSNANDILSASTTKAIQLDIVSSMITSDKMIKALNEGMEKSTNNNTAPLKAKITKLISFFKEEIKKGDTFILTYIPGKGTYAYKNGVKKGIIEGEDFQKALFGIWLSKNAVDDDLKEDMLNE